MTATQPQIKLTSREASEVLRQPRADLGGQNASGMFDGRLKPDDVQRALGGLCGRSRHFC